MQNADLLRELFRMQPALHQRIGVQTDRMRDEAKAKRIPNDTGKDHADSRRI